MALLKAFVCQVVLFGLYKLFLEQIVEQHLVPDELTRNSLVGLVCLLCFGIQLYTDVADDDIAETEEDPKEKSKSRESTDEKKLESAEISVSHEIVTETFGLNASSHVMFTRIQTTSQEIATEKKPCFKSQQVIVPLTETEKATKISYSGVFAEFSTSVPNKIGVSASTVETSDKIGVSASSVQSSDKIDVSASTVQTSYKTGVPASTVETSYEQETKTIPVLNGLPQVNASEESDEEGIEIDQLVSKETSEEAEQLMAVEAEEVETIQPAHVTETVIVSEKAEQLMTVEVETIKPEIATKTVNVSEEVETVKPEHVTEAVAESECFTSNGVNISSEQVLDSDPMIDESESQVTNSTVMESLNNIDEMPSNIIGEIESKNSVKNGNEIENGQAMTSRDFSEPDVRTKDFIESLPSAQERDSPCTVSTKTETENKNSGKDENETENGQDMTSADASESNACPKDFTKTLSSAQEVDSPSNVSTKTVNEVKTVNKNSAETSTVLNATVLSPRRNITTEDVCVTPVSIDISFIYACH